LDVRVAFRRCKNKCVPSTVTEEQFHTLQAQIQRSLEEQEYLLFKLKSVMIIWQAQTNLTRLKRSKDWKPID
jgi:hypothetical protein